MNSFLDELYNWSKTSIVDEILIFAMLVAIIESFAQNTLKTSIHGSTKFLTGLSFYMIVGYILHYAYHKFPLGKLNTMWSCISIILAMFLGYMFYGEEINRWNMLSIAFAILAIYFASIA